MLEHLAGTKNEFVFGKLMRRKIPTSNAVFDVIFSFGADIQLPNKVSVTRDMKMDMTYRSWKSSMVSSGLQIPFISLDTLVIVSVIQKDTDDDVHCLSKISIWLFIMNPYPRMFARFSARKEAGLLSLGSFLGAIGLHEQALHAGLF